MRKYTLFLIFCVMCFVGFSQSTSQEKHNKFSGSVNVVTQHLWRARASGTAPAIEPIVSYHPIKNLSLSIWGACAINGSYDEVNYIVSYEHDYFTVTLFDFYAPGDHNYAPKHFFNYKSKDTKHLFDLKLVLRPIQTLPLSITASTLVYGNDRDLLGRSRYSSYLEADYGFDFNTFTTNIFMGITPFKGLYHDRFGIVNIGAGATSKLNLSSTFQVPVSAKLMWNPTVNKVFFNLMLTLP